MKIKVANIEIFWSNGSYETPITFPDHTKFTEIDNPNVALSSIEIGTVVLKGEWTYAYFRDNFYFLEKLETKDIDRETFKYSMIRDLNYALYKCEDLVLEGELVKCTDIETLERNKAYLKGLEINPIDIEFKQLEHTGTTEGLTIKDHNLKVDEHQHIITEEAWRVFDEQTKAIPSPEIAKTKRAILATMPTNEIKSWKHLVLNKYLKELIDGLKANKSEYTLTKIDKYKGFIGAHQLSKEGLPLGEYQLPFGMLKQIDLSGLTGISALSTGSSLNEFVALRNRKIGSLESDAKTKESVRGYFEEAIFYPDDKPWENKDPKTPGQNFPLGNKDFGITNELTFVQLDKSRDNVHKIHISHSSAEYLKTQKNTLDEIDRIIKNRDGEWEYCTKAFWTFNYNKDAFRKYGIKPGGHSAPWSSFGTSEWSESLHAGIDLNENYRLRGLPRTKEGDYDYDVLSDWFNKGVFDWWHDGNFIDYTYHVAFGINEIASVWDKRANYPAFYVISFTAPIPHQAFINLIKQIRKETKAASLQLKKEEYLRAAYSRLDVGLLDDEYLILREKDLIAGMYLFDLEGTNYVLMLWNGKPSLIIKDINADESEEYADIYGGEINIPDIYQDINTRKTLVLYNKEIELPFMESSIKNLKLSRLSPSNKQNIQDNILVDYKSEYMRILELFPIPLKSHDKPVSDSFDGVAYENYLIQYRKTKEELDLMNRGRQIAREREDYEYRFRQTELSFEYQRRMMAGLGAIAGGTLGSVIKGVGLYAGHRKSDFQNAYIKDVLPPTRWYTMENLASQFMGIPTTTAITARSIFTLTEDLDKMRRQKEHAEGLNEYTIANRVVENTTFDNKHYWLDFENRKAIDRATNTIISTIYNVRDVIDEFTKKQGVGEIYIRLHKPNNKQIHMINEHYGQYGVDTSIPKYVLTWKDVRDKINVWGFKYIKWVNIKDPVLKNFVFGKFINGVKLIKPTFN